MSAARAKADNSSGLYACLYACLSLMPLSNQSISFPVLRKELFRAHSNHPAFAFSFAVPLARNRHADVQDHLSRPCIDVETYPKNCMESERPDLQAWSLSYVEGSSLLNVHERLSGKCSLVRIISHWHKRCLMWDA